MVFVVTALCAVSGMALAGAPDASQKIGVAAGITGEVRSVSLSGEERALGSGDPVYAGDTISTGANSKMQILLLDQTIFTIGASSGIKLDEFVYDPATSEGKVNADIIQGAFRFISGKIAHRKPENMSVDLPAGVIGIRGTCVAGQSEGDRSLVVLLGDSSGQNSGAINVSNNVNGQSVGVDIDQGGMGTTIGGTNIPPTPPSPVPLQDLMNLAEALGQPVSQGAAQETLNGEAPSLPSTQPLDANDLLGVLATIDDLGQQSQLAAQDSASDSALNTSGKSSGSSGSSGGTGSSGSTGPTQP